MIRVGWNILVKFLLELVWRWGRGGDDTLEKGGKRERQRKTNRHPINLGKGAFESRNTKEEGEKKR